MTIIKRLERYKPLQEIMTDHTTELLTDGYEGSQGINTSNFLKENCPHL